MAPHTLDIKPITINRNAPLELSGDTQECAARSLTRIPLDARSLGCFSDVGARKLGRSFARAMRGGDARAEVTAEASIELQALQAQ